MYTPTFAGSTSGRVKRASTTASASTSPGGTTAAAMHELEDGGFRALLERAVQAAAQRSRELGDSALENLGHK